MPFFARAKELISRLPKLAALFRHGLSCLFPGGVGMLQAFADEYVISNWFIYSI
jgi:hypothetical protein